MQLTNKEKREAELGDTAKYAGWDALRDKTSKRINASPVFASSLISNRTFITI